MDAGALLEPLNPRQREAVTLPAGHALVLAGAGSGKTRVLVHRLAWLLQSGEASPFGIMAVTFTNKAAAEMRERTESMLATPVRGMWIGTFHGLAHRFLRTHWQDAGLPEGFQILDSEDQLRTVRRVIRGLELDEARWPPKQAQWFINGCKDEGRRPADLGTAEGDPWQGGMARIYGAYEETCRRGGMVDFAELLLRTYETLRDNAGLLEHFRRRFGHILVDEFQDTNAIQYAWLRLLAGDGGRLFMVGDDDQSIYGWRGARIENIQRYPEDFRDVRVIRLEQNYRSTANILDAANTLIAHNQGRLGKNLWTEGRRGDPVRLYAAFNDIDEARFVVGRIAQWVEGGGRRDDCAILYRVSAQSRIMEEALLQQGMPYRVYGGLRFYERAEIKDALAYLRLVANRDDDTAFERVVNTPVRGIGARTVDTLRQAARGEGVSLWRAAARLIADGGLGARAQGAVRGFLELVEGMAARYADLPLAEQVDHVVRDARLQAHYDKEPGEKAQSRKENLDELVTAAREFQPAPEDGDEAGMNELDAFLAHAALEAGEGQAEVGQDSVSLMTLHGAKGLEFPLVFLCGLEEGLFPHHNALNETGGPEEERRLCYVGITRARERLFLSYAESRRLHGQELHQQPSRFLRELPPEVLEEVRLGGTVSRPVAAASFAADDGEYRLGQHVRHPKFGEGVVINCDGEGAHARVQVNFNREGAKWLVAAYARLEAT
ncbi:MAG: DNA helicase II [Gammaproteobacteria bacterium]|nr:DNA helicase II [Gammaproteobacteria bacterium]